MQQSAGQWILSCNGENETEFVLKVYAFPKASVKNNNNKFFGPRISLEKESCIYLNSTQGRKRHEDIYIHSKWVGRNLVQKNEMQEKFGFKIKNFQKES